MNKSRGRLIIFLVVLVLLLLAGCTTGNKKEVQNVQESSDVKGVDNAIESSMYNYSSEVTESTENQSNPIPPLRDPAELAGTGTPKGYHEFNADHQEAIGKAVDAVTNNLGVDRTMYNYTVEPDELSGTVYVGRFDGAELMDVISLDDKLLEYKGILDANTFAQQSNSNEESAEQDSGAGAKYSDPFEGVWKIRNKAVQLDFHDGRAFIGYYGSNESEKIDLGEYVLDGTDFPVLRMEKEFEIGYSSVRSLVFELTSENSMRVNFYGGRNGNEASTFNADRKE